MKRLAFAFFAGPVALLIDQGLGYPLVKPACAAGTQMMLVAVSALALVVALSGALAGRARLADRQPGLRAARRGAQGRGLDVGAGARLGLRRGRLQLAARPETLSP